MLDRLAELGNPFDDEDRNWRPTPGDRYNACRSRQTASDEDIVRLRTEGLSALVIAGKLGVTKSAIQKRLQILGMGGALAAPGRPKKR